MVVRGKADWMQGGGGCGRRRRASGRDVGNKIYMGGEYTAVDNIDKKF